MSSLGLNGCSPQCHVHSRWGEPRATPAAIAALTPSSHLLHPAIFHLHPRPPRLLLRWSRCHGPSRCQVGRGQQWRQRWQQQGLRRRRHRATIHSGAWVSIECLLDALLPLLPGRPMLARAYGNFLWRKSNGSSWPPPGPLSQAVGHADKVVSNIIQIGDHRCQACPYGDSGIKG